MAHRRRPGCGQKPRQTVIRWRKRIRYPAICLLLGMRLGLCAGPVVPNPIRSGFGAAGPYGVVHDSMQVDGSGRLVHVFRPDTSGVRWPAILYCHGIGAENPVAYIELIEHIVSRGHALVYAPFPASLALTRPAAAYRIMHEGFRGGVGHWREIIDSTRIGFVGHSYGGGAVPSVAWEWLIKRRWGANGSIAYIMAPWYSYDITQAQLEAFPRTTATIVQVFADDHINDHRMAKDLFDNIGVDPDRKNYLIVHSDSSSGRTLRADHAVPAGAQGGEHLDEMDYYGVWRIFDALAAYGLHGCEHARLTALGAGNDRQRFMGVWNDGRPVRAISAGRHAYIIQPQSAFINFWNHTYNPRYERTTHFNALPYWREKRRMTIRNYITMQPGGSNSIDSFLVSHSSAQLPRVPPDSGFGAAGPYAVHRRDFPHPALGHGAISLFSPTAVSRPLPAIIFLHGFQWSEPDHYAGFISRLAGQGYHVVFPSYKLYRTTLNNRKRYDLMLKGAVEGCLLLGSRIDTSRIGFVGHSYGGGAVPAVAWHYLQQKRWGAQGAFMFILAPWYVYYFKNRQFEQFPARVKLLIQVYEDERFNDWRMAEDLFYSFRTISSHDKDFVVVHSDRYKDYLLEAEHVSPLSGKESDCNAIDHYALYRLAGALAACAFYGDTAGCGIALGGGSEAQTFMGIWPDGAPVTRLTVTDSPITPYAQRSFLFKWSRPWNKRRRLYDPLK